MLNKTIFLLLFFPALCFGQKFDVKIGTDFGILNYDVQDALISANRYEHSGAAFLNLAVYQLKTNRVISLNFNTKEVQLNRSIEKKEEDPITLAFINYELNAEYLAKIYAAPKYFSAYLGAGYNGHFSIYSQQFDGGVGTSRKSHEMAVINLSLNSLLRWQLSKSDILLNGGFSLYNYGARPESAYYTNLDKFKYFSAWAGNYTDFHIAISVFYSISARLDLKPEYKLRYYKSNEPGELKLLKQSWSLGLFFNL